MSDLPFTGERFVPSETGRIAYEHYHRYAACLDAADGRVVLDVASGEGYGTALLAGRAKKAIGVEIDPASARHASMAYGRVPNLSFVVGDCRSIPIKSKSVDLIVSFETIEHIQRQDEMVREFVRVLRPDGLLIISSPDRENYSEKTGFKNPFHVRELTHKQFVRLFEKGFRHVRALRQRLATASFILPEEATGQSTLQSFMVGDRGVNAGSQALRESVYSIVVCGEKEKALKAFLPSVHLDPEDDLFLKHEEDAKANSAETIATPQSNSVLTHALQLVTETRTDFGNRLDQANQHAANLDEIRVDLTRQIAAAGAHATHAADRIAELEAIRIDLTRRLEQSVDEAQKLALRAQNADTRVQEQSGLLRELELRAQDAETHLQRQSSLAHQFETRAKDAEIKVQQRSHFLTQLELRTREAEARLHEHSDLVRQFELRTQQAEARMQQQSDRTREFEARTQEAEKRAQALEIAARQQLDLAREFEARTQAAESRVKEFELRTQAAESHMQQFELRTRTAEARVEEQINVIRQIELRTHAAEARVVEQSNLARQFEFRAQNAEVRAQQQEELLRQFESRTQDAEARAREQTKLVQQLELRAKDAEARLQEQSDRVHQLELRAQDSEVRINQRSLLARQLGQQAQRAEERANHQAAVLGDEVRSLRASLNDALMQRDTSRKIFRHESVIIQNLHQKLSVLDEQNRVFLQRNEQISRFVRYIPGPLKRSLKTFVFRSAARN